MSFDIPQKQKALFLSKLRGDWEVVTIDVPKPGPGEVLVRIEATAVNPFDWKVQAFGMFVESFPAIVGTDGAGVVIQVGESVRDVVVGDRVIYQGYFDNRLATYQQYGIAKASLIAKVPPNLSLDQAASVPVSIGAAFIGLYGSEWQNGGINLPPPWLEGARGAFAGYPIVVMSGSSSIGQYVIQLAKLSGFSPIITTCSPHNFELVKSLGATHVIDRTLSPTKIITNIESIVTSPIEIVFDCFADEDTQHTAYELISDSTGGSLIVVRSPKVERPKPNKRIVHTFGTVHAEKNREVGVDFYSHLTEYLASSDLKPNQVEIVPGGLTAIPDSVERVRRGQAGSGKLVVRPQETS
ncbi:medium-chain dehydrogenase/reductase like protein [Panus rudis PR-1116 ss-1]|nr:medium-chain dehydrogenase/reductase like protein [Panus rudis PR-1116 ss-1]